MDSVKCAVFKISDVQTLIDVLKKVKFAIYFLLFNFEITQPTNYTDLYIMDSDFGW